MIQSHHRRWPGTIEPNEKSNRLKRGDGVQYTAPSRTLKRRKARGGGRGEGEQQRRIRRSFDEGESEDKVEETKECRSSSSRFLAELEATIQFPRKRPGRKRADGPQEKPKRIKQIWNEYGDRGEERDFRREVGLRRDGGERKDERKPGRTRTGGVERQEGGI